MPYEDPVDGNVVVVVKMAKSCFAQSQQRRGRGRTTTGTPSTQIFESLGLISSLSRFDVMGLVRSPGGHVLNAEPVVLTHDA